MRFSTADVGRKTWDRSASRAHEPKAKPGTTARLDPPSNFQLLKMEKRHETNNELACAQFDDGKRRSCLKLRFRWRFSLSSSFCQFGSFHRDFRNAGKITASVFSHAVCRFFAPLLSFSRSLPTWYFFLYWPSKKRGVHKDASWLKPIENSSP